MGDMKVTDRRVERANRTRDAVVDALLALINEGNLRPTAREISTRANVSLRSLYVHFDDVEALRAAAAVRHGMHMEQHCRPLVTEGTFEERLDAYLDRKATLVDAGWNVLQAGLLEEPFSPALRNILEEGRKAARADLQKVFGPELEGTDAKRKHAQLEVCTNPIAWRTLRVSHNMSVTNAKATMAELIRGVLEV